MSEPARRRRLPAAERRGQVVDAAIKRFAAGGYRGTSTEDIALDVGLSQPYLFRLFRTKRELFLACCAAGMQRTHTAFRAACAGDTPQERLAAMGRAYVGLLADEDVLRLQLQMYAACDDPVIRAHARECYRALVDHVRELSGAAEPELWRFFSNGMLLNVLATIGLHEIAATDPWAASWTDPSALIDAGR